MQRIGFASLGGLALLVAVSAASANDVVFTEAEVRTILSHGPWPAPATRDPSNRASGNRAAIEFGEGLFFDTRLSAAGKFACSTRPILDARELGASARHVAELVRNDDQLACRYRRVFGASPSAADDEAVLVDVAKVLAAFQETFESPATPFDRFRDALARGAASRPELYSEHGSRDVKPLRLSAGEQSDLVVFLESLSTMSNPWRSGEAERCY